MGDFSPCKACGQTIMFVTTENGKSHPVDAKGVRIWVDTGDHVHFKQVAGYMTHFATCTSPGRFRKPKGG